MTYSTQCCRLLIFLKVSMNVFAPKNTVAQLFVIQGLSRPVGHVYKWTCWYVEWPNLARHVSDMKKSLSFKEKRLAMTSFQNVRMQSQSKCFCEARVVSLIAPQFSCVFLFFFAVLPQPQLVSSPQFCLRELLIISAETAGRSHSLIRGPVRKSSPQIGRSLALFFEKTAPCLHSLIH